MNSTRIPKQALNKSLKKIGVANRWFPDHGFPQENPGSLPLTLMYLAL